MDDGAGTRSGRRRWLVRAASVFGLAALLSALAVTGASAHGSHRLDWSLETCDAVIAMIPADRATIQPHLPDGFTAEVPARVRAELPPDPRLDAVLGMQALDCRRGSGLHGTVAPMSYASHWTFAEPPERLRPSGSELTSVKWDTLVPDADRRGVLRDHGLPARDGAVSFDLFEPDGPYVSAGPGAVGSEIRRTQEEVPDGLAVDVSIRFADGESYRLTAASGRPTWLRGGLVEYTPTESGIARWTARYGARTATAGTGTVELDPDGSPAQILGATTVQAYFLVATNLDYYDGTITLPDGRSTFEVDSDDEDPGSLPERARDHVDDCRRATDNQGWKLLLEVGRECVDDGRDLADEITDRAVQHVEDCRDATGAFWWELGREIRRECIDQPTRTAKTWIGSDLGDLILTGGVLP